MLPILVHIQFRSVFVRNEGRGLVRYDHNKFDIIMVEQEKRRKIKVTHGYIRFGENIYIQRIPLIGKMEKSKSAW